MKRHGFDFYKYRWVIAGAIPALLLLIGGVWLVASLTPRTPKPAASSSERALALPERPRGPVNLRATAKGTDAIELTWEDPHGPSNGFRIDRAADRYFTQNLVATQLPHGNERAYTDSQLAPGATYYYRMRALRKSGESTRFQRRFGVVVLRARIHPRRIGSKRRGRCHRQSSAHDGRQR